MLRSILQQTAQWIYAARYGLVKYDAHATREDFAALDDALKTLCLVSFSRRHE